jgi:glycosyltransferase involved in cell wall biosynthesis
MPNCVDVKNFKKHKVKKSGIINIGWMGGSNHTNDLEMIRDTIQKILKKFPHVRFNTFGFQPEWAKTTEHCIHHTWVTFDKYYKKLGSLDFDIGVAPLVDNEFNRCKSNLRVLEYSAMAVPTVASRVVPFQDIRPNITGYLAKDQSEWFAHLSALITRPKLRERIGNNAYNAIKRNNNPDKWAGYYARIFKYYATKYARSAKDLC